MRNSRIDGVFSQNRILAYRKIVMPNIPDLGDWKHVSSNPHRLAMLLANNNSMVGHHPRSRVVSCRALIHRIKRSHSRGSPLERVHGPAVGGDTIFHWESTAPSHHIWRGRRLKTDRVHDKGCMRVVLAKCRPFDGDKSTKRGKVHVYCTGTRHYLTIARDFLSFLPVPGRVKKIAPTGVNVERHGIRNRSIEDVIGSWARDWILTGSEVPSHF